MASFRSVKDSVFRPIVDLAIRLDMSPKSKLYYLILGCGVIIAAVTWEMRLDAWALSQGIPVP